MYIYGKLLIRVIRWKPDITTNHGFSTEKNKLSKNFFFDIFQKPYFRSFGGLNLTLLGNPLQEKKKSTTIYHLSHCLVRQNHPEEKTLKKIVINSFY